MTMALGILAALVPCRVRAQTTTTLATTTTTTSTTVPTIPPATLCTCTDGHCLVTHSHTITAGTIDFGPCALVVDAGVTVTVSPPGALTITASSATLDAQASIVDAGGSVVVTVPGTIILGDRSSVDVSAPDATDASISLTAGGPITLGGRLSAQATDSSGSGGSIDVTAGGPATPGDIAVNDRIRASGGGQGGGGDVCLTSQNGGIVVNAPIDASGGEFDGGCIDLEADKDLTINDNASGVTLDVSGGGNSGCGGLVVLDSNVAGNVTVGAPILGLAGGSIVEGGGDAGELDAATTVGNVVVNATVTMTGGSDGGGGGTVDLEAIGDLTVTQPLLASGTGPTAIGGAVTLFATGTTTLSSLIDVSATGPQGTGGYVFLNAPGASGTAAAVPAGSEIDADSAAGTPGGQGGDVQLVDEAVTIDGTVHANGGGGVIDFQGCTLTIGADARISADGTGTNLLQASGPMQVLGSVLAGANALDYQDPTNPPDVGAGNIVPAATVALDVPAFASLCTPPTTTTSTTASTTTLVTTTTLATTTTTMAVATTSSTTTTTATTATVTTTSTTSTRPTTSTTRAVPPVTTTTVPSTSGACTPPRCDDRGPCEPGACAEGQCVYTPMVGLDGVACRLDQVDGLLQGAPSVAFHGHALERKLVGRITKLRRVVDGARRGGRRGARALRQAAHGIDAFIGTIDSAAHGGKIDPGVAGNVVSAATAAKTTLDPLLAHP